MKLIHDKYIETLHKLYIKGMINKEQLEEKIEQWKNKTEVTLETTDNGYVKEAMERIVKEKNL
jgi:hypothetical protein